MIDLVSKRRALTPLAPAGTSSPTGRGIPGRDLRLFLAPFGKSWAERSGDPMSGAPRTHPSERGAASPTV